MNSAERTDRKMYVFLSAGLIIFFTPFIILSFLSHPSSDDFILGARIREEGFWNYQMNAYSQWTGRFFSNFWGSIFSLHHFLFNHYFFHSLLLIVLSLLCIYILFSTINRYFLKHYYSNSQIIIAAGVYFAVLSCCYSQLSTAFFWFSSAITYQLPSALFFAGIGFAIRAAYAVISSKKIFYNLATIFCIAAISGANEIIAISLGSFMLMAIFLIFKFYPASKKIACVYLVVYLISFTILAISPGSRERSAEIPSAGLVKAVAFAFARTAYTFWNIFKEPLFWLCGLFIFLQSQIIGNRLQLLRFPVFVFFLKYKRWLLIVIVLVVVLNYLPLMYLSNGSLPERATNNVIFFTLLLLTTLITIFGAVYSNIAVVQPLRMYFLIAGIALAILCNRLFFTMLQNTVSGFFYNKVMTMREAELSNASKRAYKKAVVYDYNTSLQQQVKYYFPTGTRKQVEELITTKPEHLFLFDDLSLKYNLTLLKNYYQLDTIIIIKKRRN